MADLTFDRIVEIVDPLTPQEQTRLTAHLLQMAQKHRLSVPEKLPLLRAVQIDVAVIQEPSIRREDWDDDDGR